MRPIVRARETIIGHQRKHTRATAVLSCQSVRHPLTLRTPDTHMQSHKPRYEREKKMVGVRLRLGTHVYRSEPSR